ncbi:hypothetical protein COB11_01365 [Candidatus Aerophobetes bacterium]|uniref:Uncharacterized protein n=1 Tax=Aerophobetes bacterium TaxID=2030807 RepID=A0A2A4YLX5_UNCAE|nr:MAG: hypothetical protein COB11_01365 [Candidatus Aerophobetes bacterium]
MSSITVAEEYSSFLDGNITFDSYDQKEHDLVSMEKVFNIMGYIPCVSTISGPVRILFGIIQTVVSAVKVPFTLIVDIFRENPKGYGNRSFRNITYMCHGVGNVARGFVELFPIVGNIATIFYDTIGIRVSYSVEYK